MLRLDVLCHCTERTLVNLKGAPFLLRIWWYYRVVVFVFKVEDEEVALLELCWW